MATKVWIKPGLKPAKELAEQVLPIADQRSRGKYTLADITIVVTCFLRFDKLANFIHSVRYYYPKLKVLVSDNSLQQGEDLPEIAQEIKAAPNVSWVQCPFDVGVSGVRNRAFPHVTTPLTLICEEDFVFSHETNLEALLDVLNHTETDIVAGMVRDNGGPARHWSGQIDINDQGFLNHTPPTLPWEQTHAGTRIQATDICLNWFLTKTETVVANPCDETFMACHEHLDWMLSFRKAGLRIKHTKDCVVLHDTLDRTERYLSHRKRRFESQLYAKWGITGHKSLNICHVPELGDYTPPPDRASGNIILLTIGHTGSSVVAELLTLLGWQIPNNDLEFHEPEQVRRVNNRLRYGMIVTQAEMQHALRESPQPWCLKDPRFCETLERWLPALATYRPRLLLLDRDFDCVLASYRRRPDEPLELAHSRRQAVEQHYRYWPWEKCRLNFAEIVNWASKIDPERSRKNVK